MKIETHKACDITVGDILDMDVANIEGRLWKVIRALTVDDEGHREFLLLPMFNQVGVELQYITPKHHEKFIVWKSTEVK